MIVRNISNAIQIAIGNWEMQLEGEVMKAVRKADIYVDKEKLLEALKLADSIVRCKECEYWETRGCREGCGECTWAYYMTNADDFCSYGER